jgi:hypothetical protein
MTFRQMVESVRAIYPNSLPAQIEKDINIACDLFAEKTLILETEYTITFLAEDSGNLTTEGGENILTEEGEELLYDNPTNTYTVSFPDWLLRVDRLWVYDADGNDISDEYEWFVRSRTIYFVDLAEKLLKTFTSSDQVTVKVYGFKKPAPLAGPDQESEIDSMYHEGILNYAYRLAAMRAKEPQMAVMFNGFWNDAVLTGLKQANDRGATSKGELTGGYY